MANELNSPAQTKSEIYMTVYELAEYLKISRTEAYKLVNKRSFPSVKLGKQWRVNKNAIDTWFLNKARTK